MEHLSQSPTVRSIELDAHANHIVAKSVELRRIFEAYIRKNRPNAPGYIYVPSHKDTENAFERSSKNYAVGDFLKTVKYAKEYATNFYISDEDAQEIIHIWKSKRPDIQLSWETIHLKTSKFLFWGNKPFTVKMWKISWN